MREGFSYVLSGEKTSVSLVTQSDAAVLLARTGSAADGARGVTAFLVSLDRPGVRRAQFNDTGSRAVGREGVVLR